MALTYKTTQSLACTSFNGLANSTTTLASTAAATTSTDANIVDAIVQVKIVGPVTMTASAITNILVFVYASLDGVSGWYSGVSSGSSNETFDGTDKTVVISTNGNNLKFAGNISLHTTSSGSSITYQSTPFSISNIFGGIMPKKWGIVIMNNSSKTLPSSGHDVRYTEVYYS